MTDLERVRRFAKGEDQAIIDAHLKDDAEREAMFRSQLKERVMQTAGAFERQDELQAELADARAERDLAFKARDNWRTAHDERQAELAECREGWDGYVEIERLTAELAELRRAFESDEEAIKQAKELAELRGHIRGSETLQDLALLKEFIEEKP